MPLGREPGEMENMVAGPLGKVVEGPGEDGVDLAANPGKIEKMVPLPKQKMKQKK
jgi:hypothetical protein